MDTIVTQVIVAIMAGGPQSMIVILGVICFVLWTDRNRALKSSDINGERLEKLTSVTSDGHSRIMSAIQDVRMALFDRK